MGDAEQRKALLDYCAESEIQVLVIDNLSSVSNVSENDNDEWMELGGWLSRLPAKGNIRDRCSSRRPEREHARSEPPGRPRILDCPPR